MIVDLLRHNAGLELQAAQPAGILSAPSLALRRRLTDGLIATQARRRSERPKRIYYLSIELLVGQCLMNNLLDLGLQQTCAAALARRDYDFGDVAALEPDAALGNGGLARLAAFERGGARAPNKRRARADFEPRTWRLPQGAELIPVVRASLSS